MEEEFKEQIKDLSSKVGNLERKIDSHNAKHEQDMEEIKPYMQAAAGLGIVWKALVAIGGAVLIWVQIKQNFLN